MAKAHERVWRTACLLLATVLLSATAQVKAQVSVSDGGSPSYSQAIAVPPGVAGMSPKLSLLYAGGGVNGPVGHGWSVQGISSITRCQATLAIDGVRTGVTYGPNDKLCLDGQRLIQTDEGGSSTATQNAVGVAVATQSNDAQGLGPGLYREYRTEKDSYARVRAYGYASSDASGASGPAYFRVWTKSGQIYEYGAGPAADPNTRAVATPYGKTVSMAWAVARISDTLGNAIDFKYEQRDPAWGSGPVAGSPTPGHEWNILEIQYSGNKVLFNYDLDANGNDVRSDRAETYHQGNKNVSVRRLKSITTYVNETGNMAALGAGSGTAVKTVKLDYENGLVSGRSRVKSITECAGGPQSTRCLPATSFNYKNGGTDAYQPNTTFDVSALAQKDMQSGLAGMLVGDFNGDGKTDILYWNDNPALNLVYFSDGNGGLAEYSTGMVSNQSLAATKLFSSNQCYYSIAADFNGDGITDILRIARTTTPSGATCAADSNLLLLNDGTGSFKAPIVIPTTIDLSAVTEVYSSRAVSCILAQNERPILMASAESGLDIFAAVTAATTCYDYSKTIGKNFYLIDVNGDGLLDIVTTINPAYSVSYQLGDVKPTPDQACATIICTRVYLGDSSGQFTERSATNLVHHSVYSDPPGPRSRYPRPPTVADINGDGIQDLLVNTGAWISRGSPNGDFDLTRATGCSNAIDFNGDGRADCLVDSPGNVAGQTLYPGDGSFYGLGTTATFNLTGTGSELSRYLSGTTTQDIGNVIVDVNGDGRQDILRWKDDATQNVAYLSNGDGSFTQSSTFNLGGASGVQLQKSDGTASFVVGDFTGRGTTELLRTQTIGGVVSNKLYVKTDPTPPDQLLSVTSGTGVTTTLYYVPLSNATPSNGVSAPLGARYSKDLGTAGTVVANAIELNVPMYVVATSVADSGVGSAKLQTEYAYAGLKADTRGRGLLGFREVRRQTTAPDGTTPMTVIANNLQVHPYIGVASTTDTYLLPLSLLGGNLQQLSRTTNTYCDQTVDPGNGGVASAAGPSTPCSVTAKIQKPYLYKSVETGWDLGYVQTGIGKALPQVTTTNTYNGTGDPLTIAIDTAGAGAGLPQQSFSKLTTNTYQTDVTNCSDYQTCNWVLGRLATSAVSSTVPNNLASLTTNVGSGGSATSGSGPLQAALLIPTSYGFGNLSVGASTTKDFVLANDGASSLSITVPSAASVSGSDFSFVSTSCTASLAPTSSCAVTVRFAPTAAASRSGSLTIATGAGNFTASLSGTGQQAQLALSYPGSNTLAWGTQWVGGTYGSATATLTNNGNIAATAMALSVPSGWGLVANTCTSTLAAGASCTFQVNWSPTLAQVYSGSITASTSSGIATSSLSLQGTAVIASASLSVSAFGSVQTGQTPSVAATLTNTSALAITVTAPSAASISGAGFSWQAAGTQCGGSLAPSASCVVYVIFSPTAATPYSGTLSVNAGAAGVVSAALSGTGVSPTLAKISADNFSYNTPVNTGSGHFIGVQNTGVGPVTVNSLSYVTSTGNFNAWMAGSGSGNPNGGYCWPGAVLQPGWSCGAWANADTGSGTASFNTTAGTYTYTGSFTGRALSYGGATGATSAPTAGQTGTLYAMTISNATPFTYYFPRYGAGGGVATIGRFVGGNAGNFVITGTTCGANMPPNSSCTVSIAATGVSAYGTTYSSSFQPNGTYQQQGDGNNGIWPGVPSWLVNMGTVLADVYVSVTNPVNVTTFTPTNVTASAASISGSSTYPSAAAASVTYTNNGQTPTTLTLTPPAGMTVSPSVLSCPGSAVCGTVTVSSPATIGAYSGSLSVASSAGGSVPAAVSVSLGVNGSVATLINASPALSLASTGVGGTSPQAAWTLRNDGNVAMTLSLGALNSPFSLVSNTCSNIAPAAYCNIMANIATTTAGSFSQTGITLNGANVGSRADLSISGSVVSAVPFTSVGPSGTTWTFTNPNTAAMTITSIGLQMTIGFPAASVSGGTCVVNGSVAPNATCTVSLTAPPATCKADSYNVRPAVTTAGGTSTTGGYLSRTNSRTICP